ncbi:MAG: bifunctional riboflavin kinase/FAD synthetase [Flavobacterium sp.]|nr:bifunctional riboflavin kinase/FAD synthetase [Pedobacter sp.]
MKVYNHIDEFTRIDNAVVTIGTFDGVHVGHQKIIARLLEITRQKTGESVILTFFPHPRMILHPEDVNMKLINTINEKASLLKQAGIDHLIITPFTRDFSNLSPQEYIKDILVDRIGTRHIVIGYDHRFGKDRSGGLKHLQQYAIDLDYEVEEIPEQDIHDVAVSSTKIRQAILTGDINTANDFLGYPFSLTGKIIKGDQIGRQLGFPTANLFIEENYKLVPADGIYAVKIHSLKVPVQKSEGGNQIHNLQPPISNLQSQTSNLQPQTFNIKPLNGMAYIGHRPTLNGMTRNIEVNIFDFDQDIYGEFIQLSFLDFIRSDQKFNNLAELREQLKKDEIAVRLSLSS